MEFRQKRINWVVPVIAAVRHHAINVSHQLDFRIVIHKALAIGITTRRKVACRRTAVKPGRPAIGRAPNEV